MPYQMDEVSKRIRSDIFSILLESKSGGHLGPAMSLVEILRAILLSDRGTLTSVKGQENARLILSKGHGCLALYAVLHLAGKVQWSQLLEFCKVGTEFGGHPERDIRYGIEATSGSLGHGMPFGVGIAIALRHKRNSHSRICVVVGDGELNEGSNWEAGLHAVKHRLGNLVVLVDANGQQCNGDSASVLPVSDMTGIWRAMGWRTETIDGHAVEDIRAAISGSDPLMRPTIIFCETTKGRGMGVLEGRPAAHHHADFNDKLAGMLAELKVSL